VCRAGHADVLTDDLPEKSALAVDDNLRDGRDVAERLYKLGRASLQIRDLGVIRQGGSKGYADDRRFDGNSTVQSKVKCGRKHTHLTCDEQITVGTRTQIIGM
jgi:hypothetical protein